MSLNRALAELFKAIREEAAHNDAFAARLEDALALYKPPRRRRPARPAPAAEPPAPAQTPPVLEALEAFDPEPPAPIEPADVAPGPPALNPIALYSEAGEAALRSVLEDETYSREALSLLIAEHNLDPAGAADDGDKPALVEQIVAQARRRVERDRKLFDY
ncbi:MAG: hypothetical protein AB7M12_03195 [Hyphomonadaceae bacterium]